MEFYKSRNFDRKKPRNNSKSYDRPSRSFRNSRNDRKEESATVTCADCGTECQIPFIPKTDRPVYCSDCFRQNKPQDSGNDRYSRNDRDSRYSRNDRDSQSSYNQESNRNDSRSRQPKNHRFLKKQDSFYSNGSEKFYASLKEKLFEILGGKICSSCGFKDERALGISQLSDDTSFDGVTRGGSASSWGKYISEPSLAREELKVLCLNCNKIRQPISKPKSTSSRPKQKKSRYFPR